MLQHLFSILLHLIFVLYFFHYVLSSWKCILSWISSIGRLEVIYFVSCVDELTVWNWYVPGLRQLDWHMISRQILNRKDFKSWITWTVYITLKAISSLAVHSIRKFFISFLLLRQNLKKKTTRKPHWQKVPALKDILLKLRYVTLLLMNISAFTLFLLDCLLW